MLSWPAAGMDTRDTGFSLLRELRLFSASGVICRDFEELENGVELESSAGTVSILFLLVLR